jgi:hypothetical protein
MSGMRDLPRPSAWDLSDLRFITVSELLGARDALIEVLREGGLEEASIREVFALLLGTGWNEAGR